MTSKKSEKFLLMRPLCGVCVCVCAVQYVLLDHTPANAGQTRSHERGVMQC